VKFDITAGEQRLRDVLEKKVSAKDVSVELVAEHAEYSARTALTPLLVQSLAEDLL
jgi:hypothetical protein